MKSLIVVLKWKPNPERWMYYGPYTLEEMDKAIEILKSKGWTDKEIEPHQLQSIDNF